MTTYYDVVVERMVTEQVVVRVKAHHRIAAQLKAAHLVTKAVKSGELRDSDWTRADTAPHYGNFTDHLVDDKALIDAGEPDFDSTKQ